MAAASKDKTLEIPALHTAKMLVRIEGERPLLCNRFSDKALNAMLDKQMGKASVKKEVRKPDDDFTNSLYLIDDKPTYGFPLRGVQKALITAGGRFTGAQQTFLRGALWLLGSELIEIHAAAPKQRRDLVRLAGIGRTVDVRVRGEFFPWSMAVAVEYIDNWITPENIVNLFRTAGQCVGIGDWRLELKNGYFGTFKVAEVSEL